MPPMRRVQLEPAPHRAFPFVRNFAQHRKPRADILAALVVVRRRGEHRIGKMLAPLPGMRRGTPPPWR